MKSDVKQYINEFAKSRKALSMNKKLQRILKPCFCSLTEVESDKMDFIFDSPESEDYTQIMIVVDILSQRAHVIPLTDKRTALDIA